MIAFKRWLGHEQVLIVASLNNMPYDQYTIHSDSYRLPTGGWKEIFNSDSELYGGANVGNGGAIHQASNGSITIALPANGLVLFVLQ
ncbi:alpha amylase C-terminal domain-containing protein [Larkinella humicola]|uniref:alpha amylase C-terminal domain-containing protein n=1 Tax=Larkinella humicola TaxID=2607654 RepID=UPI001CDA3887|nr:alpha amylase C-terminal domain-containing protein [Larkinella humicola]